MGKWVPTTAAHEDTLQGQTEELLTLRSYPASATTGRHAPQQADPDHAPVLLRAFAGGQGGSKADSAALKARVHAMDATWAALARRIEVRARARTRSRTHARTPACTHARLRHRGGQHVLAFESAHACTHMHARLQNTRARRGGSTSWSGSALRACRFSRGMSW